MPDWEADVSLHQTAFKLLFRTSLNSIYLIYVAYQHYLSIWKSLPLTLDNKFPLEKGEGFCVVFLSTGDQVAALDHRVKLDTGDMCNEFKALRS